MDDGPATGGAHDSPSPSQGGSSAKRKRTTRACDHCRSRKHKCNGRQPVCSACDIAGLPCGYGSELRKRGLATGYVRSLELLLGLVFSLVPNGEKTVADLLEQVDFALDDGGKLVMTGKLISNPATLRHRWLDSPVQNELDRRLSHLDANGGARTRSASLDRLDHSAPHRSAAAATAAAVTPFDPIRRTSQDHIAHSMKSVVALDESSADMFVSPTTEQQATKTASAATDAGSVAFPPNSQELLDIYFSFTHCWLPIVEKHRMFKVLYSSSPSQTTTSGDLCTFWAILAHSTIQITRIQDSASTVVVGLDQQQPTPRQLYDQAKRLVPDEEGAASAGHVKALLILGLCNLYRGSVASAWRLVGRAARMCLSLHGQIPERTVSTAVESQVGTLLACFALDTLVSCQLNRPPHLRTADIQVLPPLEEMGLDEWAPWSALESAHSPVKLFPSEPMRAVSTFNYFVGIVKIMNDIMWQPAAKNGDATYAGHYSALQTWHDQLPSHCALPAPLDDRACSPQVLNLHLAFKTTIVLLKRKGGSISSGSISSHSAPRTPLFDGPMTPAIVRLLSYSDRLWRHLVPATFPTYRFFGSLEATMHTSLELDRTSILSGTTPDNPTHMSRYATNFHTTTTDDPMAITPSSNGYSASHAPQQLYKPNLPEGSFPGSIELSNIRTHLPWGEGLDKATDGNAAATYDGLSGNDFLLTDYSALGDLGSLEGIEWATQTSEFMQNLGFAASEPESEMRLHPP
ncbi:hypothetical protein VTK73DRAFT_796 [Phialemonium thermophilum]|uniref:Zn(2)-C6 fungal-type domain-containing protein n=1 Tax=Phialemonium thermophilum TaxID=223376 RepID=A0ABR3XCF3_9PEZI